MFKLKKKAYELAPTVLKRLVNYVPYSWAAGRHYGRTRAVCKRLDFASRDGILAYQERELGKLLYYAVHNVPAYQQYRRAVERYSPFDALQAFPLLSKQQLQENTDRYVSRTSRSVPHHRATTGGTSGSQLVFLEDDATYAREMAFMHAQWARVGYGPHLRKATFRGVAFPNARKGVYWQENPIHNELQFSPFHMNDTTLQRYVEQLIKFRPAYVHGYPSALDVLSEYVLRNNITPKLPSIRAALLGSEGCSLSQRERISSALDTRVYTFYGHSERAILGGECEQSTVYHHFPAYGVLEIVSPSGTPGAVGERGELVGTGFLNRAMPLIRYRTDDHAIREHHSCNCGRKWDRFSNVEGRWNIEGVLGKNGSRISAAALNMHGGLFRNVIRYQYYQKERGVLEIRLIVNDRFSSRDEKIILCQHNAKLLPELEVAVKIVDHIPLTERGKQQRVVCEVN